MTLENERISIDPDVLNGKPAIRGTRIAVQTVVGFLSSGDSVDDVLENYPTLTREDISSCLLFASDQKYN